MLSVSTVTEEMTCQQINWDPNLLELSHCLYILVLPANEDFFFPFPIWQVLMKLHSDLIVFNYLCLRTSCFTKLVFKEIAFFRTSSLFLCENSEMYCKITEHNMSLLLPFSMTPIIKRNWVLIQFSYICINMSPEGKVS